MVSVPVFAEPMLVALGSAIGAVARFGLSQWALRAEVRHPFTATLAANLVGCAAAGALTGLVDPAAVLVVTGFLASFTTVSSFSLEAVGLWQSDRRRLAAAYVLVSVVGGLILAGAGWSAGAAVGGA